MEATRCPTLELGYLVKNKKMSKTKSDLIKDMQNIAEEIERKKEEVELLLTIIENLEKQYFDIAEEVKLN